MKDGFVFEPVGWVRASEADGHLFIPKSQALIAPAELRKRGWQPVYIAVWDPTGADDDWPRDHRDQPL